MTNTKERLELHARLLVLLDERRNRAHNNEIGTGLENLIIARELRELEQDILDDPGALESQLVRVRRKQQPRDRWA